MSTDEKLLHIVYNMNDVQEVIMDQALEESQSPTVSELRRERERAEMIDRIMDAAREMFVRDGYEAVTLRKIAQAIEYSPGAIYQYFKDKQALVMAIIRKDLLDIGEYQSECLTLENPIEQLVELARRYAAWSVAHPNHYRLMRIPPPAWVEYERELHEQAHTPLDPDRLPVVNSLVKEAIERGLFKEKYTDPGLVAATLWAGLNGVVLLEVTMPPEDRAMLGVTDTPFEPRLDTLIQVFLDGFLKDRVEP
jgi:AcrR family transcriptional regulator